MRIPVVHYELVYGWLLGVAITGLLPPIISLGTAIHLGPVVLGPERLSLGLWMLVVPSPYMIWSLWKQKHLIALEKKHNDIGRKM